MRYLSFLLLFVLCIACGDEAATPLVPPTPPTPVDPIQPKDEPKQDEDKPWAELKFPRGFTLVQHTGNEYVMRGMYTYHSWISAMGKTPRLGARLANLELSSLYLPKEDEAPLKLTFTYTQGLQVYEDIDINREEEVKKLYQRFLQDFNKENSQGSTGAKWHYKDARQLHSAYWGIYPDVEKLVYGKSYHELDPKDRHKEGIVYDIELLQATLINDYPDKPFNFLQQGAVAVSATLGQHAALILHVPQEQAQQALSDYLTSNQASDAERLVKACEAVVFVDFPRAKVWRGQEALERYLKLSKGEYAEPTFINYLFMNRDLQDIMPISKYSLKP